jgi:2-polyprenyl-3-methyl-5-hydroxy-6-metoxy-1,4-benzoquinol methylase
MEEIENFHYSEKRDSRVKETAEIFTPDSRIQIMLDELTEYGIDWTNPPLDKKFLDPTCGSGNFLIALARRGIPLRNIYGVDFMEDNITTVKKRLKEFFIDTMTDVDIDYHLGRNIICADALTYHYQFWWYIDSNTITDFMFDE